MSQCKPVRFDMREARRVMQVIGEQVRRPERERRRPAAHIAKIRSGQAITGVASCGWWPASSGKRSSPQKVMKYARKV